MKKIRIGLEWFLNPDHLPFIVANELGFSKQWGWELELVEPKDHYEIFPKLESGDLDLAITEPIHLVLENNTNIPLIGFGRFLHTDGGVMYLEESGIKSPKDLVHKTITYPNAPSPLGMAIIKSLIKNDGLSDPVNIKTYDGGFYHTKTLAEKKADAATLIFYNFEIVEAQEMGLKAKFFSLKEWQIPDFCQLHLITLSKKIHADPNFYLSFAQLLQKAVSFVKQNPEKTWVIWEKFLGNKTSSLDKKIYEATWPCFTYDFNLSPHYWQKLIDWCYQEKLLEKKFNVDGLWFYV